MLSLKQKIFLIGAAVIVFVILALILALQVQGCRHEKEVEALQQQILEQTNYAVKKVDENTSAIATIKTSKGISKDELADEIKKQIKDNKLDAVYKANIEGMMRIEEKLKGKSTTTEIVTHNEKTVVVDKELRDQCNTCLAAVQVKVPFDVVKGPWHISGYTLSGTALGEPGEFDLSVELAKKLAFQIVLAQGKKGDWSTYIYSEDFDPQQIESKISIKPFKTKWYEKFMFPINFLVSKNLNLSLGAGIYYRFLNNFAFGINAGILFLGVNQQRYDFQFGVGVIMTTNRKIH